MAFLGPSHPSGGLFLVADDTAETMSIIDFEGVLLGSFGYRPTLGLTIPADVTAITTGPLAGAFAVTNSVTSEVVVFALAPQLGGRGIGESWIGGSAIRTGSQSLGSYSVVPDLNSQHRTTVPSPSGSGENQPFGVR